MKKYGCYGHFYNILGKIYYSSIKFRKEYEENYFIYVQNSDDLTEVLKTRSLNDPVLKIASDGKYAILCSAHLTESYGEIKLYDFQNYRQIDEMKFFHIGLYRVIANFFEFNNHRYIIYQANLKMCNFENEVWHTYVYNILEKRNIYKVPFSFALKYVKSKKILIIEKNKPRKEARFYKDVDESIGIDWVIKEVLRK